MTKVRHLVRYYNLQAAKSSLPTEIILFSLVDKNIVKIREEKDMHDLIVSYFNRNIS